MNSMNKSWYRILAGLSAVLVLVLLFVGCGTDSVPTSAQESERPLWTPAPGDELAPGRAVPLVNSNYWEELYGMDVNPFRRVVATAIPIDEDGGIVTLGYHYYVIPAGAVHELRSFTLGYASYAGVAVDCGPSPCSFDSPVMLVLSYRGTQYDQNGADPSALQIWYAAEDGSNVSLESHVDTANRVVWAEVDHFSRYILG